MRRLDLPVVAQAGQSLAGDDRLAYIAAGNRTGTLRRRLGDSSRLMNWLDIQSRGNQFTSTVDDLDYLEARAAEPCGKTVLESALEAVVVFETASPARPSSPRTPWSSRR